METPTQRNGFRRESYILSVDVGTTSIRCHVYDKEAQIRGSYITKVNLLYPEPGLVELDPEELWRGFVKVVNGAVQDSGLQMRQMEALGISTQRGTFTTWDRKTGVPFHNFISWQDLRAVELVRSWNNSCTMKAIHSVMMVLHFLSKNKRFQAASLIVFSTQHVTFRLAWALQHWKQISQAVAEGNCYFGTIDTWLLYKLTKGLYPVVGWKIGPEVVYLAEGNAADTGTAIKWAQELELFSDVRETDAMASSVANSDGVCFVPSFSGLQAPLNDPKACASFMGLKPSTNKSHLVRAILESVAFRNKQLYETMLRETHIPIRKIRADGGVCTNDFVMQLTADLFGRKGEYTPILQSWERALKRSMNWYGKP
ncbi:unnamed protein product [Coregonus sp. 'balchen']|nr:unnamed protein product [Coregonus sp. 'balchen']